MAFRSVIISVEETSEPGQFAFRLNSGLSPLHIAKGKYDIARVVEDILDEAFPKGIAVEQPHPAHFDAADYEVRPESVIHATDEGVI